MKLTNGYGILQILVPTELRTELGILLVFVFSLETHRVRNGHVTGINSGFFLIFISHLLTVLLFFFDLPLCLDYMVGLGAYIPWLMVANICHSKENPG